MTCEKCRAIDKKCGFRVVGYFTNLQLAKDTRKDCEQTSPNKQYCFRIQLIEVEATT